MMRIRYLLAAALIGAAHVLPVAPSPAQARERPCPVPVPAGTTCGRLTVPERRSDPDGRQIAVPFAVHRAESADRRTDPIVFMGGGPGSASIRLTRFLLDTPFARDRDLIVLEQRGSRLSEPSLSCPEIDTALLDALSRPGSDVTEAEGLTRAGRACRERLAADGVDLRGYTTAEIAADVVALRHELGYERWTLMGVSYSTRSMLAAAAADPEGTSAVVLDSFLPAEIDMYDVAGPDLLRTLDRVAPGLSATMLRVADRLNRRPAPVTVDDPLTHRPRTLHLSGDDLATLIMEGMHDADVVTAVPALLQALDDGHDELLGVLGAVAAKTLTSHDTGLYYAVNCQDEVPFNVLRPGPPRMFYTDADPAVCRGMDLPAGSTAGATTNAPVLVLGGAVDPATPVDTARAEATQSLPHATTVEFAGVAHAVFMTSRCGRETIAAFLTAPSDFRLPCDPAASPYRTLGAHEPYVTTRAYDLASDGWWHKAVPGMLILACLTALVAGIVRRRPLLALAGAAGTVPLAVAAWLLYGVTMTNPASLLVGVPRPVAWCVLAAAVVPTGTAAAAALRPGAWRRSHIAERIVTALLVAAAAGTLTWWYTG